MTTKGKILQQLRENRAYLANRYGIRKVGVFGSYARGTSDETSDVDIFVEFEHPIGFQFVELVDYLEQILGKEVDVLTPAGLQGIRVPRVANEIVNSIEYA